MLDNYILGNTERISPEGPIPVLNIKNKVEMLGGVGNVVRNLSTLATNTHLVSITGNDNIAKKVEKKLDQINCFKQIIKDKNRPTTTKSRFIANNQQILRVDHEDVSKISKNIEEKIYSYSKKKILKTDAIIISDYKKGLITSDLLRKIISFSKKNNKPIVLDPKSSNYEKYKGVTIITPNINELELVLKRKFLNNNDIISASKNLISKFKFKYVLVTMGKSGMILVSSKKSIKLNAEAQEIFDVSGAGDTVVSFIAAGLASSLKIENIVKIANIAAGVVVNKTGTSVAHLSEVLLSVNKNDYHLSKVMKISEAINTINFWKKKKRNYRFY